MFLVLGNSFDNSRKSVTFTCDVSHVANTILSTFSDVITSKIDLAIAFENIQNHLYE
jgi:acetylglutamate synthase